MAFSFLTEENIYDLYTQAKEHTSNLTKPFSEWSRIARNRPKDGLPAGWPKVTDGTAGSAIRKSTRRTIQQLPSGVIDTEKENSKWPIIADFVYRTQILPLANTEYDLLQKIWMTSENGKTFGVQVVYTPMINHDGKITPDYLPVYWGDIAVQPGKKSIYDCNYLFIRSWWQESDVEALIEGEKSRAAEAKKNKLSYKPVWDIEALEEIKGAIIQKDDEAATPSEQERVLDPSGIEIVTGFQRGLGSTFYIFNPATENIVRRKKNKDLRGKMPIDAYYYDIDGSNPMGRSVLEYIGPIQNLIDSDMQAYQYNRAKALQPTINVFGNVNERRLSFAPNALNKIPDPNARVDVLSVDTSAIRDYPNMYGLNKSQILNQFNSPDTSISSEVGNPGFGKTPTAIKTQNASMSVDDNAERKGFEAFFENWSETAINLYFCERTGKEDMQLDEETANKLRELESKGYLGAGYVKEDNTIIVDFDEVDEVLHFRVDASTSKVNSEAAQLEALQALVQALDASQSLSQVVPIEKKLALWNAIVANSGVEKSDDLKVSDEELEKMVREQQAVAASPEAAEPIEGEVLPTNQQQAEYDVDLEQSIADQLRALGVDEDLIQEVPSLLAKGYSEQEVLQAIQGVMNKEQEEVDGRR